MRVYPRAANALGVLMIWDVTASPAVVAGTVYVASIATSDSGHVNAIEGDTP